MIKFKDISKEFKEGIGSKKVKALEDLTLDIHKGEVFGFLGPNGARNTGTLPIFSSTETAP